MPEQEDALSESEWVQPSVTFYLTSDDPEIQAMEIGLRMTDGLSAETRMRVLRYLLERATYDSTRLDTARVHV